MKYIRSTDHWDAHLYDDKHAFVSNFGNDLIELLAPKTGEFILDIGCGTGDLANILYDLNVNVIGIDKSENMIEQARSKYPDITFRVADATEFVNKNKFNAVFSNATLHWVQPPEEALHRIYDSLKHGGRFIAEFGGKGNVKTITDAIISAFKNLKLDYKPSTFPWYFPSIAEYTALMEDVGFRVTFAQHFDRPTPLDGPHGLRNWINMFTSSMFSDIDDNKKEQIISKVEENLKETLCKNGSWQVDYKRIRVIGVKE